MRTDDGTAGVRGSGVASFRLGTTFAPCISCSGVDSLSLFLLRAGVLISCVFAIDVLGCELSSSVNIDVNFVSETAVKMSCKSVKSRWIVDEVIRGYKMDSRCTAL